MYPNKVQKSQDDRAKRRFMMSVAAESGVFWYRSNCTDPAQLSKIFVYGSLAVSADWRMGDRVRRVFAHSASVR